MESRTRVLIFDDIVHVETDKDTFDPNNEWARTLQLMVRLVASRICNTIDITATKYHRTQLAIPMCWTWAAAQAGYLSLCINSARMCDAHVST